LTVSPQVVQTGPSTRYSCVTRRPLVGSLPVEMMQSNIAFWEQSEKPPRSDLLHKLADALAVTVTELLNVNGEMSITKRSTSRPPGKVRRVFEEVSKLPRRQQEHIVRVVSALVMQYEQSRQ
jgi:transcriptional regulator with XRE-family HTH domain